MRIICDEFVKTEKQLWPLATERRETKDFNRKILAVNNMYRWLYNNGLLKSISFEYEEGTDAVCFAVDASDLAKYKQQMQMSGIEDAELAVRHIFDEPYTPCMYSGAIQLGWTMQAYRDFDDTVERSWECGLIKRLGSPFVLDVLDVLEHNGAKEATSMAFRILRDVTIRQLSEDDIEQVKYLDGISEFDVSSNLDTEGFAWGIFLQGKDLVGYCTLGGADDPTMGYDKIPGWTEKALVLSDVFVHPDSRGNGFASKLVCSVLESIALDTPVFLTLLHNDLTQFYTKFGFVLVEDATMLKV